MCELDDAAAALLVPEEVQVAVASLEVSNDTLSNLLLRKTPFRVQLQPQEGLHYPPSTQTGANVALQVTALDQRLQQQRQQLPLEQDAV